MIEEANLAAALLVLAIGAFGLLARRNLIKICLALSLMETAVILLVVAMAYEPGVAAPILDAGVSRYADPLPHALALTAIVIAAAMNAIGLALAVRIHHTLGTLRIDEVQRRLR